MTPHRLLVPLALAGLLAAASARAAVAAGDAAPDFAAPAALAGKPIAYSLADALRRGPVVVYFYPSAFTGGCNLEAHTFAVQADAFAAAGASVVGVSLDDIGRLERFSADPDYCAGRLPVASDADGRIARAWGVAVRAGAPGRTDTRGDGIAHGLAQRSTFVVDRDGRIAAAFDGLSPVDNVMQALATVRRLAAAR